MQKITLTLTEIAIADLYQGLIIAMKELDKYENGSDRILSDRLEVILKDIEMQALQSKEPKGL